jgi:hypothetical protein
MAEVNAGMLPHFWGEGKRQLDEKQSRRPVYRS